MTAAPARDCGPSNSGPSAASASGYAASETTLIGKGRVMVVLVEPNRGLRERRPLARADRSLRQLLFINSRSVSIEIPRLRCSILWQFEQTG